MLLLKELLNPRSRLFSISRLRRMKLVRLTVTTSLKVLLQLRKWVGAVFLVKSMFIESRAQSTRCKALAFVVGSTTGYLFLPGTTATPGPLRWVFPGLD